MKYLKHYWICTEDGKYSCHHNPVLKRHPEQEYPGLDVKIWIKDENGIDVCLSVVPDTTEVFDIFEDDLKVVQVLTEEEFNSVWIPYTESSNLSPKGVNNPTSAGNSLPQKNEQEELAKQKYQEAREALYAL